MADLVHVAFPHAAESALVGDAELGAVAGGFADDLCLPLVVQLEGPHHQSLDVNRHLPEQQHRVSAPKSRASPFSSCSPKPAPEEQALKSAEEGCQTVESQPPQA